MVWLIQFRAVVSKFIFLGLCIQSVCDSPFSRCFITAAVFLFYKCVIIPYEAAAAAAHSV